jgi:hypothetical protein
MVLAEMEQRAVQELVENLKRRLEQEMKNLDSARFDLVKLEIRVKLFGEQDLDDRERKAFTQAYPEDIAKHEVEIARLQAQLDKLLAYEEAGRS